MASSESNNSEAKSVVTGQVVVGSNKSKRKPGRRVLIIVGCIFLLLAAILLIPGLRNEIRNRLGTRPQSCSSKVIGEAQPNLYLNGNNKLEPVSKKIVETKGFASDAGCVYILTVHYINTQDADNAQKYFDIYRDIYNTKRGIGSEFGVQQHTPEQLQPKVALLKTHASEVEDNAKKLNGL